MYDVLAAARHANAVLVRRQQLSYPVLDFAHCTHCSDTIEQLAHCNRSWCAVRFGQRNEASCRHMWPECSGQSAAGEVLQNATQALHTRATDSKNSEQRTVPARRPARLAVVASPHETPEIAAAEHRRIQRVRW